MEAGGSGGLRWVCQAGGIYDKRLANLVDTLRSFGYRQISGFGREKKIVEMEFHREDPRLTLRSCDTGPMTFPGILSPAF